METNRNRKQNALVITVIVVDIILAVVLTILLWDYFVTPPSAITNQTTTTSESTTNSSQTEIDAANGKVTYKNDTFTFQYPATGWTVKEETISDMPPVTTLTSSDYVPAQGMGIESGASISVNVFEKETNAEKEFTELQEQRTTFGLEDLQKTSYQGQTTITYHSAYEGVRYHTLFFNNGKIYDVVLMYEDGGDPEEFMDVYDMVTLSFTFI